MESTSRRSGARSSRRFLVGMGLKAEGPVLRLVATVRQNNKLKIRLPPDAVRKA
jgi:hypothetical protein